MDIPTRINKSWIASLADEQLIVAEAQLHATFREQETIERRRTARYVLLEGPEALVSAWHRWMQLSNESVSRGLAIPKRR